MLGDLIEIGLNRSVWFWCLLSAIFAQTWPPAALLAVVGGLGMYSTALTNVTTSPARRPRDAFVLHAITIVCGLGLYGASRLLFRTWQPLVALAAFLGTQAALLALSYHDTIAKRKAMFDFSGFGQRLVVKVKNIFLGNPPRHPVVRYPLLALGIVLGLTAACTWLVLSTFLNLKKDTLPHIRSKARASRLKLRSWTNSHRAILASNASHYTHRPLDDPSTTIRLLRLLPKTPFGQIRCELFEATISDVPEYQAVSYTWGPPDFTGLIYIQGRPLPVSKTIEALFHHLSSYAESRVLWIDQICINQADDAEKSSQVPLMRDIYSKSANTIVWLDGVEEPWKTGPLLAWIWEHFVHGTPESSLAFIRQCSLANPYTSGWTQLLNIFANPYFSRVWVVQEVVLSPMVTVLASGEPLNWDHLSIVATKLGSQPYLDELRASPGIGIEERIWAGILQVSTMGLLRVENLDLLSTGSRPAREPESLLSLFSNLHSTLPVDRLYGLISLFPADRVAARPWLSPDYTNSARQLYTEATKNLLLERRNNGNEILSFAGAGWQRNIGDLPSWVPDWSSLTLTASGHMNFNKIQNSSHFNASAGTELAIGFTAAPAHRPDGPPVLSMQGKTIDAIYHLGPVHSYTEHNRGLGPSRDALTAVLKAQFSSRRMAMQYSTNPYHPTSQPLQEAFWRTLVADTVFSRPAHDDLGRGCRLWERLSAYNVDPAGTNADLLDETNEEPSVDEIKTTGRVGQALREAMLWNSTRINCCVGRRFCVTARGYLAMVPPGTEEGDILAILYGLNTPFVLRRASGQGPERWVMVGEAYVHGVMDGEAMMGVRNTDSEVFDLI